MKIAIASDHAGFPLKHHLVNFLHKHGFEVLDLGVENADTPADYPDAAQAVGEAILSGKAERGILLCGSGVGACIAANKMKGIYASITHDTYSAAQGVEHDRMNVMCLGARVIGQNVAETLALAFLNAKVSEEDRHARRFGKVQKIENS
ncbi:MAG: RpiB/LacA/LacB family sugar-phosphate isomerase [bacterium]|nr:RpiB/LacA/LacB family sugar-phosphate isomerase [bacterium]